jgi:hypothetical protein
MSVPLYAVPLLPPLLPIPFRMYVSIHTAAPFSRNSRVLVLVLCLFEASIEPIEGFIAYSVL